MTALEEVYQLNNTIEVLETTMLEYSWVIIILEMLVVDRDTKTVQAKAREVSRIRLSEKVIQPSIKKILVSFSSKNFQHGGAMFSLVTWISRYEVLHIHPSTEPSTTQGHLISILVDDLLATYAQET